MLLEKLLGLQLFLEKDLLGYLSDYLKKILHFGCGLMGLDLLEHKSLLFMISLSKENSKKKCSTILPSM